MKKINTRKLYYHLKHRYFTMNNTVVAVALLIGAAWAWGSIEMMQRNYGLQKELDAKTREQTLLELETANLSLQQRHYKSSEYQELAVRERVGLANPGEKALILPPNTEAARTADAMVGGAPGTREPATNFEQWVNFLFGGTRKQ